MADSTRQNDRILKDAAASLQVQSSGGRHRSQAAAPRAGTAVRGSSTSSVGKGSADLKRRNLATRLKLMGVSIVAILIAAMAAGLVLGGIGFAGIMLTLLAIVAAVALFSAFPRTKAPKRVDLARTADARQLVARTELWLEHQRPALPAPAVQLVDTIGLQLDALGLQLEHVDPSHPAATETRKLVGEHLPEMVDSYRKIPTHLRRETRAGGSAEDQLISSLGKISGEIDRVTRQLADGALDDLAVRSRFLDYKYGAPDDPLVEKN